MHDFFSINRNALIIRPTRAMIDWANAVFPEDPIDYDEMGQHDEQDVFLLPDFGTAEETEEWLKENCEDFLTYVLEDWCMDKSAWPSPLDWALFRRFFDFAIETSVADTMDEDYDEEAFEEEIEEEFKEFDEEEGFGDFDFEDN
ncbi:MAG: hypothetical protein KDD06_29290 [Phaeodactylibacter sp.]|nr:hypothetical protein [Phaeodactylibacter sp.]MCB9290472.1 hypothetical protein [Lewinellaceae bacterium]